LTSPPSVDANTDSVLLDGVIGALCGGENLTAAQKEARAREIRAVIAETRPGDAMQTMLLGQCLMFNAVIADAGKDLLHRTSDALKLRAQSNLNGLNRTLRQNVSMFLKLRDTGQDDAGVKTRASKQRLEHSKTVVPRTPDAVAAAEPPLQADAPPANETVRPARTPTPEEDGSWVFEPCPTWLIETPAEEVARLQAAPEPAGEGVATAKRPTQALTDRDMGVLRVSEPLRRSMAQSDEEEGAPATEFADSG
jgi:hypothetical protein